MECQKTFKSSLIEHEGGDDELMALEHLRASLTGAEVLGLDKIVKI